MKTLDFYSGKRVDPPGFLRIPAGMIAVVMRDGDKLVCWRMDLKEAEQALAGLSQAILEAQE